MKLPNLSRLNGLIGVGKTFLSTHRPEILLGTSITATVGAVVMAAKGGYKSGQQVMAAEHPSFDFDLKTDVLDVKEKIQLTWMNYLPAAGLTAGALGSTTALHLVHVKEKKALATAALAAVDEVKKGIVKVTDEETEKLLEDRADENGIARIENGDGDIEEMYLIRDAWSGRDKWSNQHQIEDALIEVNMVLNNSGDVELNHFYTHAGFNTLPEGNRFGWNAKDMVSIEWSETKRDDGRPVRVFTFRPKPAEGFDKGA